jgi:16S rRNA (guanine966-N2)-methyltransferase
MVRIIAGKYRGRILHSINNPSLRPTSDRVKETLFDIIGDRIEGAAVLDLFAGIGNIGIEALSRGASKVTFIEHDRQMIQTIKKNIEILGIGINGIVSHIPAMSYVRRYSNRKLKFDFIYMDPPYDLEKHDEFLSMISHGMLLNDDGLIVVEHIKKTILRDKFKYIERVREKVIGNTCLSFYELKKKE